MSDINELLATVSRETVEKLNKYQTLLFKWNQSTNLVGPIKSQEFWDRHIIDCLQLISFLPDDKSDIADLGSGAGLPGVVLAIATQHRFTLIDKNYKKAAFLRFVSRETITDYSVWNHDFSDLSHDRKFDVIVSRALTSSERIYHIAYPFLKEKGYLLLLKGKTFQQEIDCLKKNFNVTCLQYPSITNAESSILKIFKGN